MQPKKAAFLVVLMSIVLFFVRLVGTIWPATFRDPGTALASAVVHLATALAVISFFVAFYRFHARPDQPALRLAAGVAAVGTGLVALVHAKYVYELAGIGEIGGFVGLRMFDAIAPLFGTTGAILFFIVLMSEARVGENRWLRNPAAFALAGFIALDLMQGLVAFNYFRSGVFRWLQEFSWQVLLVTLPILVAAFLATLSFFVAYHRGATPDSGRDTR